MQNVRCRLISRSLRLDRCCRYRGEEWQTVLARSKFSLTPRGFGRTSFALAEAIQLGTIPVYIWSDVEWLPYRGTAADWASFGLSVNVADAEQPGRLRAALKAISPQKLRQMRSQMRRLRESHFTYSGVLEQIGLFMVRHK